MPKPGDLIIPLRNGSLREEDIAGELGGMVLGEFPGRTSDEEWSFFKSVGNAVQDMSVAAFACESRRMEPEWASNRSRIRRNTKAPRRLQSPGAFILAA